MERFSRNQFIGPLTTALLVIAACGCRTQSSAMSNPFMAPDRVPPPSTRPIAPGTAQPYYQGDPLPAIQGAAPAPIGAPVAQAQAEVPPAPNVAFTDERSVAIPTDAEDLRFALPAPEPQPMPEPAAAPIQVASQPPHAPPPLPPNAVTPASYTAADAYQASPAIADESVASGMWRSPQSRASTAPVNAVASAPPVAEIPNPMPVELRAVTPPSNPQVLQPAYNSPPRMRFPDFFGWGQPQPQGVAATAAVPQPATIPAQTTPTSQDGFRPRGSLR